MGEKMPLKAEEMVRDVFTHVAGKQNVCGLQPDSLGVHRRDFCTTWCLVLLKSAVTWSLVENLSLFALLTGLVFSRLNLKM